SQLERGKSNASFGTLRAIAQALQVTLADLFTDDTNRGAHILPKSERPQLEAGAVRKYMLSKPPLVNLEVYLGEIDPGISTGDEPYTHGDSQEILVVLGG